MRSELSTFRAPPVLSALRLARLSRLSLVIVKGSVPINLRKIFLKSQADRPVTWLPKLPASATSVQHLFNSR